MEHTQRERKRTRERQQTKVRKTKERKNKKNSYANWKLKSKSKIELKQTNKSSINYFANANRDRNSEGERWMKRTLYLDEASNVCALCTSSPPPQRIHCKCHNIMQGQKKYSTHKCTHSHTHCSSGLFIGQRKHTHTHTYTHFNKNTIIKLLLINIVLKATTTKYK